LAGVTLLSFLAIRFLIRVPSVQTWIVQKVTTYLSGELNTTVTVGAVDIRFFKSVVLNELFIADQNKDTLIYTPSLQVNLSSFSIRKNRITVREAIIQDARIGIVHKLNPREYNIDFILRYFEGDPNDTLRTSKPWEVKVEKVKLVNCNVTYREEKDPDTTNIINWDDLHLKNLNAEIKDIIPNADTLNFVINNLSFVEKSGFQINKLYSVVTIKPGSMEYNEFLAETPHSTLVADLKFNFDSIPDFEDFIEKVRWNGKFKSSTVSFKDLQYFATELFHINRKLTFSGNARGTVDRFKVKNLELKYADNTYFKGNVSMAGLPNFDETYMELDVADLSLRKEEVESMPSYPFDSLKNIELPDNIAALGTTHFKGKFNGFYNDFVAYGNITTALGFFSSDINLKIADNDRQTIYKGSLTFFDFDMGTFLRMNPDLGRVSLKTKVEGRGFKLSNVEANVESKVSKIELYGYNYSNIVLNGHLAQQLFTGEIGIKDPNLDLDFEGEIDLRAELPVYNFNSSIRKANLARLNILSKRDVSSSLSAEVNINMVGNTIDNAQGTIQIEEVTYKEFDKEVKADLIFLESKLNARRELTLESDFANAQIIGNYTFSDLPTAAKEVFSKYIPAAIPVNSKFPKNLDFSFNVQVKQTKQLLNILYPKLQISKGTILQGSIKTSTNDLSILFKSDKIKYEPILLSTIQLIGTTGPKGFDLRTKIDNLNVSDNLSIDNLNISGITKNDTASILVSLQGKDSVKSNAAIRFDTDFLQTGYTTIKMIAEKLTLNGQTWDIDPRNYLLFDSLGLLMNEVNFIQNDQQLNLNGIIGPDTSSKFNIGFINFESANLNDLLNLYDVNVGGIMNGGATIRSVTNDPALIADLKVDNLRYYSDTLGDASLSSKFDPLDGVLDVNAIVTRGGDKNIGIRGKYFIKPSGDELDFRIDLQKTYIKSFSHYLEGLCSNLGGIASANLLLTGLAKKPVLTGKATLQKVSFMIDYLKATYNFSAEIDLDPKSIGFNRITLNDVNGNKAIATGKIFHDNLSNWYFDIDINTKNTQILNTGIADNELFYGTANATGSINIKGYLDYIIMNIGLKSEKGTKIYIPLSNPEEVSQSSFITFVSIDTTKNIKDNGPDFSGIELNMDFEVTPDANMYLIFDSKIGDIIEGNGKGNITMTVSPSEDFKMFGNYEIEQGKYLFTLQNVINKPFFIERGGFIRWSGDPYDANINISAIYKTKAGLFDLFQDSTIKNIVPVDLQLRLTDKLFNPTIAFDINVQNVDPTIQNQIKRLINTEEEKYRQAVALLVARRFTSPSEFSDRGTTSRGNVVGTNAYELLSNQLSNWASQISNQVNVNVIYNPGDEVTTDQLEIGFSSSLLNDRVLIDVSGGTAASTRGSNTTNIVGDFNLEFKASKDGRVRFKAFNRSNNNSLINNINSPYTQGVGVFYRQEFNRFSDLTRRFRSHIKKVKSDPALEQQP